MPIYEYVCNKCGHEFEVIQSFSDKPMTRCEKCGGRVRKLVSQSAFHLKGSGWYVTDYASKHPGSKPNDTPEKSDSGSSKSKPAADAGASGKSDTAAKPNKSKSTKT